MIRGRPLPAVSDASVGSLPTGSEPVASGSVPLRQRPRAGGPLTSDPPEALARVVIAGLFLGLAFRIGENFLETGRLTGLLLLVSESAVVVLTLARRAALCVDRRWSVRVVVAMSVTGPLLLWPSATPGVVPELFTVTLSACGLLIVIVGKLSLGRSFGLLPANRGVVCSGLYRLVRHPIYLGYLVTHVAFLAANATVWNVAVLALADAALLVRTLYEERTLVRDPRYASYQQQVRWRILPGVV